MGHTFQSLDSVSSVHTPAALSEDLVPTLYEQLRTMAAGYFAGQSEGHTLQPTALVHEAFVKLFRDPQADQNGRWASPGHFLAVAALAMRQVLVDHARAAKARKRPQGPGLALDATPLAASQPVVDVLELNDAIDRLAALDERAAHVVTLRFFAGLTIRQAAQILGVSDFTVENDWRAARAFLARELSNSRPPDRAGA